MNQFAVLKLFDKLWDIWPNKDKEHSARKALKILCKEEDIDPDRMLASARIYVLSLNTPHCHELGNWLRNDIWKDIYVEFRDVFAYEKKLKERRAEAIEVIEHWKENRRSWWCSIASIEDHIPQVEFAMRNKTFKENWQKAFEILYSVFEKKFPEGDWRRKITPSLSWFTQIDYDKSTVLKLIEGEYGRAEKEKKKFDPASLFPDRGKTLEKEEAKEGISDILSILGKKEKPSKKQNEEFAKPKKNMENFLAKVKKEEKEDVGRKFGFKKA